MESLSVTVLPMGSDEPKSRWADSSERTMLPGFESTCRRFPKVRGKSNREKNVESTNMICFEAFSSSGRVMSIGSIITPQDDSISGN